MEHVKEEDKIETAKRIVLLLRSNEQEMCDLAISIFGNGTYEDYFIIRTMYTKRAICNENTLGDSTIRKMWLIPSVQPVSMDDWKNLVDKYRGKIKFFE